MLAANTTMSFLGMCESGPYDAQGFRCGFAFGFGCFVAWSRDGMWIEVYRNIV
jgi:hypothetical protein